MKKDLQYLLRELLERNKMSQAELSQRTGIRQSSISDYLTGKYQPKQDKIDLMAAALGVSPAYLLGWESDASIDLTNYPNIQPITKQRIPLLGEIACGKPIFADEDRESYIEAGTDLKADFCLRCQGDSMINARINDGDIVFIKAQPIVETGEIAAVIIDDEATLKRVYYYKEKNLLELRAENPKYQSLIYSDTELDQVQILGKAIAFQSDVV